MDEAVELAELRRRAYGPGGGIDAAGIARLRELEQATRTPALTEPSAGRVDEARSERPDEEPAAPVATDALTSVPPSGEGRGWLARRPTWQVAAAGVIIGAVVAGGAGAVVAAAASGSGPDARLALASEQPAANRFHDVEARAHEQFHPFEVYSAPREEMTCLYVALPTEQDGGWYGHVDCVPAGDSPRVSLWIGDVGMPMGSLPPVEGIESGTHLRFELRGDSVDVWVTTVPQATPTPRV